MSTGIKKDKKPVEFYTWLRSGLRKLSRRWPAIYEALDKAKVPYKGDNKRRKWSYVCAECDMLFESKQVAVDHKIPAGQLNCKDDIADFVERLFCGPEGLQVLCHECHDIKTLMDKHGYTKQEAHVQKLAIAICKNPVKEIKQFCYDYGYSDVELSNPEKRRVAVEAILRSVK